MAYRFFCISIWKLKKFYLNSTFFTMSKRKTLFPSPLLVHAEAASVFKPPGTHFGPAPKVEAPQKDILLGQSVFPRFSSFSMIFNKVTKLRDFYRTWKSFPQVFQKQWEHWYCSYPGYTFTTLSSQRRLIRIAMHSQVIHIQLVRELNKLNRSWKFKQPHKNRRATACVKVSSK